MSATPSGSPSEPADDDQPVVNLCKEEIEEAKRLANERGNAKYGIGSNIDEGQDPEEVNEIGMLGEVAAAKYLGVDYDDSINKTGDDGYDLLYQDVAEIKVDVKATKYEGIGRLLVKTKNLDNDDLDHPDTYILTERVDGQDEQIRLVGFISRKKVEAIRENPEEYIDFDNVDYDSNPAVWPRNNENVIVERKHLNPVPEP